jgi:hypothetical protein
LIPYLGLDAWLDLSKPVSITIIVGFGHVVLYSCGVVADDDT